MKNQFLSKAKMPINRVRIFDCSSVGRLVAGTPDQSPDVTEYNKIQNCVVAKFILNGVLLHGSM